MSATAHIIFKNSMNLKSTNVPTNYSIQFNEFANDVTELQEMPIDYSRRYSEIQNTLSFNFGLKHKNEICKNGTPQKWFNGDNNNHITNFDLKPKYAGSYQNFNKSKDPLNAKSLKLFDKNVLIQNNFHTNSFIEQVDVPTNYSIQFTEYSEEENGYQEEPIDYSKRYSEIQSSQIKPIEVNNIYNDTVKTFCTEDTPLNYLSVAVSLNDLHCIKDDFIKTQIRQDNSVDIYLNNNIEQIKIDQSADINYSMSQLTILNMGLYNFCENSNHSPSEKPKAFFTEGTPANFSRTSSPMDLLSDENYLNQNYSKIYDIDGKKENYLPCIKENEALKIISPLKILRNLNKVEANVGKSVTFDECQQTPMMFSRCSSLGSLSSFEIKSIHSSLISEYSRRASEVVSPSDLPDSPGDSFPPSVNALNVNKVNNSTVNNEKILNINFIEDSIKNFKVKGILKFSENSSLIHYADEGTPPLNLSPKSNLSKISSIHFNNDASRAIPLGEENLCNLDESDDIKLSEDDELMVAECINMAMPTKSIISNISHLFSNKLQNDDSLSDNDDEYDDILLSEVIEAAMPKSKKQKNLKSNVSNLKLTNLSYEHMPPHNANLDNMCNLKNKYNYIKLTNPNFQQHVFLEHDITKNYAEEGTPIDFSRATSLSNLIVESGLNSRTDEEGNLPTFYTKSFNTNTSHIDDNEDEVVKSYKVEDTPAIFSCNDSISSLEENIDDIENEIFNEVKPRIDKFIKSHLSLVFDLNPLLYNSPIDKLNKGIKIFNESGPNLSSTPIKATNVNNSNIGINELNEQLSTFKVKNTQVQFSGESSLSSLSFGSNGAETSNYENDLLQECINAAMPKCKKKKVGKLKQSAGCPSPNDTIINNNKVINHALNKRINPLLKLNPSLIVEGKIEILKHLDESTMLETSHEKINVIDLDATEDDYFPSGPSTETNNTIIYKGIVSNIETSVSDAVDIQELPLNSITNEKKDYVELDGIESNINLSTYTSDAKFANDINEMLNLSIQDELTEQDASSKEIYSEPLSLSGLIEEFNRKRVELRRSDEDSTLPSKSLSQLSSGTSSSNHSSLHIDHMLFNDKEIAKPHLKSKILSLFWKGKKKKVPTAILL